MSRGSASDTERAIAQQLRVLTLFIEVYCAKQHGSRSRDLCPECADLLAYATGKLRQCPYDPKPKCKDCPTHCYAPEYRARIREVMRFSGTHFVKRGRLDWLVRYFLTEGPPARPKRPARDGRNGDSTDAAVRDSNQ